jgi:hypothetical protein
MSLDLSMAKIFEGLQIAGVDKMIKAFKNSSQTSHSSLRIENSRAINVGNFQSSILSICASLTGNPFDDSESMLVVRVKNEGKSEIRNFKLVAEATMGATFIQPGEILGASTIKETIRDLAPGQSITYKVSVRSAEGMVEDSIEILLHHSKNKQDLISAQLPLVRKNISKKSA